MIDLTLDISSFGKIWKFWKFLPVLHKMVIIKGYPFLSD